jgi:hypothetical protein
MELDLGVLINQILGGSVGVFSFISDSFLFKAFKLFMLVYVVVLFADVVMLFMLRSFGEDLRYALYGAQRPMLPRGKAIKRWEAILKRLESGSQAQYKAAILEVDNMANEVLAGIGLKGENMAERLEKATEYQIEAKPLLLEGHALRNAIIGDPNFQLSFEVAQEAMMKYKKFFDEVELF